MEKIIRLVDVGNVGNVFLKTGNPVSCVPEDFSQEKTFQTLGVQNSRCKSVNEVAAGSAHVVW